MAIEITCRVSSKTENMSMPGKAQVSMFPVKSDGQLDHSAPINVCVPVADAVELMVGSNVTVTLAPVLKAGS